MQPSHQHPSPPEPLELGRCLRVRCEPGWSLPPHWSERLSDDDLWFVWEGKGKMVIDGQQTLDLRPGVGVWMRPGHQYLAQQDERARLGVTAIHFSNARPPSLPSPPDYRAVPDLAYADRTLARIALLGGSDPDHPQRDTLRTLATQLLAGFLDDYRAGFPEPHTITATPSPEAAPRLSRVLADISANPGSDWSHAVIAEHLSVPEHTARRVFRQHTGLSPRQFVIQQRIRRARHLLTHSAMTLEQIADGLGYRDVYYFNRQFYEQTGTRPGRFRRDARSRPPV
ncbi:MAG: helix-turn-helix domain-containing protein [Planctomycetota bacterium]